MHAFLLAINFECMTGQYGACSCRWLSTPSHKLAYPQEDAHSAVLDLDASSGTGFFGVFDGHGGKEVAKYAALHLASPSVAR